MKNLLISLILCLSIQSLFSQQNGQWLIEPQYYQMGYMNDDAELFPFCNDHRKWGYVDKSGKVAIPFKYERAYPFSEGLAHVKINGKYGYIDNTGNVVIQPTYYTASMFQNGRAIIGTGDRNILIDTKGHSKSAKYIDMGRLSENYIACKKGYTYDIIDLSGKVVKAKFCTDFFYFSEGMGGVKIYGKWGFVDENLKTVIKPQFTEKLVYAFHDGYARFKKGGKVGVIDKTGKVVLPAKYQNLYEFSNGLAAFSENGKWGYLNIKGEVVIEAQYSSANNFKHGMAVVESLSSGKSLIDINNQFVLENMRDIRILSSKLLALKTTGGWGIFLLD